MSSVESVIVSKFGGTSLADVDTISRSVDSLVKSQESGVGQAVVVSAMTGVTDKLLSFTEKLGSDEDISGLIDELFNDHKAVIEVLVTADEIDMVCSQVEEALEELTGFFRQMQSILRSTEGDNLGGFALPIIDSIASAGERLIAPVFAACLRNQGVRAVSLEADQVFVADEEFGQATILDQPSIDLIEDNVLSLIYDGRTVIVPGFHTKNHGGFFITFGRGGSDYSATKLAQLINKFISVTEVRFNKADVDGALSADPGIVGDKARLVGHLTYKEAHALATSAAKVLHPRAIIPAKQAGIPVVCQNTFKPEQSGTRIDGQVSEEDNRAKIVTAFTDLTWLRVEGWVMNRPGILAEVTQILADQGIDIKLVSQPISEHTIDILATIPVDNLKLIEESINEALETKLSLGEIDAVSLTPKMGAIQIVGHGVNRPEVLEAINLGLSGTDEFPVDYYPGIISSGSVDYTVILKDGENIENAVRAVHAAVIENNQSL